MGQPTQRAVSYSPRRLLPEPWEVRRRFRLLCVSPLFCRRDTGRQNRALFKDRVGAALVPRANARGYMTSPLLGLPQYICTGS